MEKIVAELKKIIEFKDTTREGDIVLIAAEKPQMIIYALVLGITRDETTRDEWWRLNLQLLSVPPQKAIWTLRTPQFTGGEIFTMGGRAHFIKAIAIDVIKVDDGRTSRLAEKNPGLRLVK